MLSTEQAAGDEGTKRPRSWANDTALKYLSSNVSKWNRKNSKSKVLDKVRDLNSSFNGSSLKTSSSSFINFRVNHKDKKKQHVACDAIQRSSMILQNVTIELCNETQKRHKKYSIDHNTPYLQNIENQIQLHPSTKNNTLDLPTIITDCPPNTFGDVRLEIPTIVTDDTDESTDVNNNQTVDESKVIVNETIDEFNAKMYEIAKHELDKAVNGCTYDPELSIARARKISQTIEHEVKTFFSHAFLDFEHRIIAQVFMGELKDDGAHIVTQCMTVYFTTVTVETEQMFATAIVCADPL